MPTEKQTKTFAAIVSWTNKTFQQLAEEAEITYIPDHFAELNEEDANKLISYHKLQKIEFKRMLLELEGC